jgi:hypothetical protein
MDKASRIQQIERELNDLFAQKKEWIERISAEIEELDTQMEKMRTRKYTERLQQNILRINDEIKTLEAQITRLIEQKWQKIARFDDDIHGKEAQLGVDLGSLVRKDLDSLCDQINKYMVNAEYGNHLSYDTTGLMQIIIALSVDPRRKNSVVPGMTNTTSAMVQTNIHAIAEFMRRRIMLEGDSNNEIISYKATDDGLFDIHLSLKNGAKHLRIYSVRELFCLSDEDYVYKIKIDLTDHQRVAGRRAI